MLHTRGVSRQREPLHNYIQGSGSRANRRSLRQCMIFLAVVFCFVNICSWLIRSRRKVSGQLDASLHLDAADTNGFTGGPQKRYTFAVQSSPPMLDSCRRCAAFSASDFVSTPPDSYLAAQDPDGAARAEATAGFAATARHPGDLRRQQCWQVGPFLGPIRDMADYHGRLLSYIYSPEYRERAAAIGAHGGRGIVISAGGSRFLTNLLVTLAVLRWHFNCTLPVEVAWQGPSEMDAPTWAAMKGHFGPLSGFDVQSTPHPVQGLHAEPFSATSYSGKIYALALTSFSQVLMLDADSLPLMDPTALFDDPRFVQYGSLFWPDAWTGLADSRSYAMYGMDARKAKAILLINRQPDANRFVLWGDKDTFRLAFSMVGKAHCYNQVAVPPSVYLYWVTDRLITKATSEQGPGWLLGGFVQNLEDVPYVHGYDARAVGAAFKVSEAPTAAAATVAAAAAAAADSTAGAAGGGMELSATGGDFAPALTAAAGGGGGGGNGAASVARLNPIAGRGLLGELTRPANSAASGPMTGAPLSRSASTSTFVVSSPPSPSPSPLPTLHPLPSPRPPSLTAAAGNTAAVTTPPTLLGRSEQSPLPQRRQQQQQQQQPNRDEVRPLLGRPVGRPARPGEDQLVPLVGSVQPAFLHRTINKFRIDEEPHVLEALTAPITQSWASYFLAHDNPGPTRGVPWDYCVPETSIRLITAAAPEPRSGTLGLAVRDPKAVHPSQPPTRQWKQVAKDATKREGPRRAGGVGVSVGDDVCSLLGARNTAAVAAGVGNGSVGCPVAASALGLYLQAIDSGVPLDRNPSLERSCAREILAATAEADARSRTAAEAAARSDADVAAYLAAVARGEAGLTPLPRSAAAELLPYLETPNGRGGSLRASGGKGEGEEEEENEEEEEDGEVHGHGRVQEEGEEDEDARAPAPLLAVQHDWGNPWPCAEAPFVAVVRASYRAYLWVRKHKHEFPILSRKA